MFKSNLCGAQAVHTSQNTAFGWEHVHTSSVCGSKRCLRVLVLWVCHTWCLCVVCVCVYVCALFDILPVGHCWGVHRSATVRQASLQLQQSADVRVLLFCLSTTIVCSPRWAVAGHVLSSACPCLVVLLTLVCSNASRVCGLFVPKPVTCRILLIPQAGVYECCCIYRLPGLAPCMFGCCLTQTGWPRVAAHTRSTAYSQRPVGCADAVLASQTCPMYMCVDTPATVTHRYYLC